MLNSLWVATVRMKQLFKVVIEIEHLICCHVSLSVCCQLNDGTGYNVWRNDDERCD